MHTGIDFDYPDRRGGTKQGEKNSQKKVVRRKKLGRRCTCREVREKEMLGLERDV